MFDWIKNLGRPTRETYPEWKDIPPLDNVYQLPKPKAVPPMPDVEAPAEPSNAPCYQVGKTEDGRVTLRLGNESQYSQLTMNNAGVDSLIEILLAAKDPEND